MNRRTSKNLDFYRIFGFSWNFSAEIVKAVGNVILNIFAKYCCFCIDVPFKFSIFLNFRFFLNLLCWDCQSGVKCYFWTFWQNIVDFGQTCLTNFLQLKFRFFLTLLKLLFWAFQSGAKHCFGHFGKMLMILHRRTLQIFDFPNFEIIYLNFPKITVQKCRDALLQLSRHPFY